MIRSCHDGDVAMIHAIINDAAQAYQGVIPQDCWHEPYMPLQELRQEIRDGVVFWGAVENQELSGVMGLQDKGEVTLIRHAYVRTQRRNAGIGSRLLQHLESITDKTLLIGTWAAAAWALSFYRKNGYQLCSELEKNLLLRKYWNVSDRQIETSIVLAKHRQCLDSS